MFKDSAYVNYKIVKHFGILLVKGKSHWTKELNLISWNNKPAKYDIRFWSPGHEKIGKGISLTKEEAQMLLDFLNPEFK